MIADLEVLFGDNFGGVENGVEFHKCIQGLLRSVFSNTDTLENSE
jgi:hypothetical protein